MDRIAALLAKQPEERHIFAMRWAQQLLMRTLDADLGSVHSFISLNPVREIPDPGSEVRPRIAGGRCC